MPVKAPPPPPPPPSWWSAFVELNGESFLINPQGQSLINGGAATLVTGVNLTLYKDKAGFINNVTVGGLYVTDWSSSGFQAGSYWSNGGQNSTNGALFDTVLAISGSVTFAQYWTLSNTYYNVYSNDVADKSGAAGTHCNMTNCSGFPGFQFDELKLSLNDSFTGWPITFNPYVTFYYEFNSIGTVGGGNVSAACFSCQVNNYDFFIGMVPTIDLTKYWGIPVTLKAPTYVTVGPTSFFNGNPDGVGAGLGVNQNVGVFTTGLTAIMPLSWLPAQYGHWYAKAGFQWYDVINTAIQASNAVSMGTSCTTSGCLSSIFLGFGGVGVAF